MKKILISIILIQLFACEQDNINICSEKIKGKQVNHLISDQDLNAVKSLFKSNGLSLDNFQVYRLLKDNYGNSHVKCYQYVNDLNVFFGDVIFHFNTQNHYTSLSGDLISNINVRPYSLMSTWQIAKIFQQSLKNDNFYGHYSGQQDYDCFSCELGYYDLNGGTSYASPDFRLVWKVTPKNSEFPFAFIDDSKRTLIYYDNGIRY